MIEAVLFDLDDTLYDELSFVRSGFREVARYAYNKFGFDGEAFYQECICAFEQRGRGRVFNHALGRFGLHDSEAADDMVSVYRAHLPDIQLDAEALNVLQVLRERGLKSGIVTDGLASVQRAKVQALKLASLVDVIIYTDELGREFWKPHELPFRIALSKLLVNATAAVYVGNDDNKDFVAANRLGLITVKVAMRQIACDHPTSNSRARYTISQLSNISPLLFTSTRTVIYGV